MKAVLLQDDIYQQHKSSFTFKPENFEKLVLSVFEKFQEPKMALNSFIYLGSLVMIFLILILIILQLNVNML